jgi:hypothetical protein
MILDSVEVALMDGTMKAMIDVYPGAELMSIKHDRAKAAPVVGKTVENHNDVVCLILSNGGRLVGSRDQKVAVFRNKRSYFTQMADVEIGAELMGSVAGGHAVVRVTGIMYHTKKEIRLVGLKFDGNESFVAGGVLCR